MNITTFLFTALMIAILFGGTVLVHELGHFLTAKWFKLRVDAFSIGMGPVLWQKVVGGTAYRISLLPIGGYVALPQMDITGSAFENEDAKQGKLEHVEPWKRIIIAVAGPAMNVIAAFLLATVVWMVGKPFDPNPGPPVVGYVAEDSAAYAAGMREGDVVRRANGDKVTYWVDVVIAAGLNPAVALDMEREGEPYRVDRLETTRNRMGFLYLDGVYPMDKTQHIRVGSLINGFPAEAAGVRKGDVLHQLNGEDVVNGTWFWEQVQASGDQPLTLTVLRGRRQQEVSLEVTTQPDDKGNRLIGIQMQPVPETVHPRPLTQMHYFSGVITRTLRGLARPRERREAAGQIGGPVMMIGGFGHYVGLGLGKALWFTALINVNLAIINLMPLVVLDGGHITMALFEWVSGRKVRRGLVVAMANTVVVLLISLMVFLTFRDTLMFWKQHQFENNQVVQEETIQDEGEPPEPDAPLPTP